MTFKVGLSGRPGLDYHPDVEVLAAAPRGVRLTLGARPPRRGIGVSVYVDFTATAADWAAYHAGWADIAG
jgi:hypothetical protein